MFAKVILIASVLSSIAFGQIVPPSDPSKSAVTKASADLDTFWEQRAESQDKLLDFLKSSPANDYNSAWKRARLAYYIGFFVNPESTPKSKKLEIFKMGYESAEIARKLEPKKVEGHYWYAVTFGGYGLTKGVFASLSGASKLLESVNEAIAIDPNYYYGGPLRVRGRLYFKLPGTISFGDKQKALTDLKAAVASFNGSKLNHIYLAEILAKTDSKAAALKELEIAKNLPDIVGQFEEASYKNLIAEMEKSYK